MDTHRAMEILSGRRRGAAATLLRTALLAAAGPYSAAMRLRRRAYGCGLLPRHSAGVPVICVGNITTGGTGKTPMVAWVAGRLVATGARPAVLTRGYKSVNGKSDEAELLSQLLGPDVPVIVNPDRVAGAAAAVARGATVLVMDDGFQHCRLRRDLDIVLIDATNPFGFGHCLPRGLLREPTSALADADAIVITRSDQAAPQALEALRADLSKLAPQAYLYHATHKPSAVLDECARPLPLEVLAAPARRVFAFCGLANPDGFFDTVKSLGANLAGQAALEDHADYTQPVIDG
ncbi:MAG: tetraacyldisaccharide 4'-kinase, partial [Planctomycetaceae bacterium]